jgi:hypothetical protein
MQARKAAETAATPVQLSLRIRHPSIDPEEISSSLELTPEHCFKAGAPRKAGTGGRTTGRHTQTYWLAPITPESWPDPIEPEFLAAIAGKNLGPNAPQAVEGLQAASRNIRSRSVDGLLLFFLHRLNSRHAFLQRIQSDGGDVSVIMVVERESAADFTLPVSVARLLAQLGISIEFNFDS